MFVLIIDDHPLLRQAIKDVIHSHFSSPVVREASTAEDAIRIVRAEPVEVAILDISLPDSSGLTVLKRIKKVRPSLKCLVLTMHDHPQYVRLAMSHGASGYLTKGATPRELYDGMRTILSGGQVVMEPFREVLDNRSTRRDVRWPHESLSVRELEVLALLAKGCTASQVARRLKLSIKTVSTYRTRLLEKLQLETTADLIRYAVDHQLVRGRINYVPDSL
jgi:DNA-binding NarL/FixJ family response regulator